MIELIDLLFWGPKEGTQNHGKACNAKAVRIKNNYAKRGMVVEVTVIRSVYHWDARFYVYIRK